MENEFYDELKKKEEESRFKSECLEKFELSEVPHKHKKKKEFTGERWIKILNRAKEISGSGIIIAMVGTRGVGKTQFSVELIRHVCKQNKSALYTKAIDVFLSLREAMASGCERNALKQYLQPSLLVIDAMEERGETKWEDRLLSHVIDKRYDEEKDTVLISNQKLAAFNESIGVSVLSRIKETGGVVECDWESFR